MRKFLSALGEAFDPKLKRDEVLPRPFLAVQKFIEFFFKFVGFFLVSCLAISLSLATCSQNLFVLLFPVLVYVLLITYLVMGTIGAPIYLIIGKIENTLIRRLIGWSMVVIIIYIVLLVSDASVLTELLERYMLRLFPEVSECKTNIID